MQTYARLHGVAFISPRQKVCEMYYVVKRNSMKGDETMYFKRVEEINYAVKNEEPVEVEVCLEETDLCFYLDEMKG